MYSRLTRALTADELAKLKNGLGLHADGIALICFPMIGFTGTGLAVCGLLKWIGSKLGFQLGSWVTFSLIGVLCCLGVVGSILMLRGLIRSIKSRRTEIRANTIEVLRVQRAEAVTIGEADNEVPMVLFDIGGNKLLCLIGQWMWDETLFDTQEACERFPSDEFCVSYLPESGTVLRVEVLGRPLGQLRKMTLEQANLANRKMEDFKDCVVLDGHLDFASESQGKS